MVGTRGDSEAWRTPLQFFTRVIAKIYYQTELCVDGDHVAKYATVQFICFNLRNKGGGLGLYIGEDL